VVLENQYNNQWVDILRDPFKNNSVGISGPKKINCSFSKIEYMMFFCVMIKKDVFNKIGLLDEGYYPGYVEDNEFSLRAHINGYLIKTTDPMPLTHEASLTFLEGYENLEDFFDYRRVLIKDHLYKLLDDYYPNDLVNVIVPTYKRYERLERCLKSIDNQTYMKIKVYVCADGNDDKVKEIVEKFNQRSEYKKYIYLCLDEHEGSIGGRPRIMGIDNLADTGYVCFVDDDNKIYPTYVETLHKAISSDDKNVVSYCRITHSHLSNLVPNDNHIEGKFDLGDVDSLNYMVKNDIAKKCKNLWIHEKGSELIRHDFDFVNECSKYGKSTYIKEVLGDHCFTESGYVEDTTNDIKKTNDKKMEKIKLNLGCGGDIIEGYINCDINNPLADIKCDVRDLPFESESVDEIFASHIIEHFDYKEGGDVLHEWNRVLKKGGKLTIECPDLDKIVNSYITNTVEMRASIYPALFGFPWIPGGGHKFAYDSSQICMALLSNGFENFIFEAPTRHEDSSTKLNMRVSSEKIITKNKVYDCFMFHNELDILEIRLNELDPYVDKFVLVESRKTHSRKDKPLYFEENKYRFRDFLYKIIHIVVDDFPDMNSEWAKDRHDKMLVDDYYISDRYQRDQIKKGLKNCDDNDIIIITDIDEIIRGESLKEYDTSMGLYGFNQKLYYYKFNCKIEVNWPKARIMPYKFLKDIDPSDVRNELDYHANGYIDNGGWHFSYIGDVNHIMDKIRSFSHQELNTPDIVNEERVRDLVENAKDLYNRNHNMGWVEIDNTYPKFIIDNYDRYVKMGYIKTANRTIDREKLKNADYTTFNTLFEVDEYGITKEEIEGKVVVDIGGNFGFFSMRAYELGAKEILTFEPDKRNYDNLTRMIEGTTIKSYKIAVSDRKKTVNMSGSGTIANIHGYDPRDEYKEIVDCISLSDIVDMIENKSDDMALKLDCEGAEYDIVLSTPIDVMRQFETLYVEIHDFLEEYLDQHEMLKSKIEEMGYEVTHTGPLWGTWYQNPDGSSRFEVGKAYVYKFKRVEVYKKHPDNEITKDININEYNATEDEIKNSVVIDIGANIGYFSILSNMLEAKEIISFEPEKNNFNTLCNNTEHISNITLYKKAVLDGSMDKITITNAGVCSNIYTTEKNAEVVDCISLEDAVNMIQNKDNKRVLKLDCEGCEFDIILKTPKNIIQGFDNIYVEIHDGINPLYINKIDYLLAYLNGLGFTVTYEAPVWYTIETDPITGKEKHIPGKNKSFKLTKYKIYDCFMFYNELDILDIRFDELYDVVDKFVISEATLTHSGKPKPLYFEENKHRYSKYIDKIIHIIVDDFPETNDPWVRERHQRESLLKGLTNCNRNDIILSGDADEIPRKNTIKNYHPSDAMCGLELDYHFYQINCIREEKGTTHYRILPYWLAKEHGLCWARYQKCRLIKDSGWHFSFLGDIDHIINKIESYAHQEYNNDYYKNKNRLSEMVRNAGDMLEKGMKFHYIEIDGSFPGYVIRNQKSLIDKKLISETNLHAV